MHLILQHEPAEGPGRLKAALRGPSRTVRVFDGEHIPGDLTGIASILSLGGEMNADDDLPWIPDELHLLRQAHDAGVPVLGVCLGSQLLALALGGRVGAMAAAEVGWLPVRQTCADPLTAGLPDPMVQFHAHRYAVQALPPAGTVLLSSGGCAIQGWRVGPRSIGLQFHCEWPAETIAAQREDPVGMVRYFADYDRLGDRIAARLGEHLLG